MFADQDFYDMCFRKLLSVDYGLQPKLFRAKQSATAEGENCTYCPTLYLDTQKSLFDDVILIVFLQKQ